MPEEQYEYEFERNKLKKYLGADIYNTLKSYHTMVAGGSILSIFNNSEINDIDVYFKNKKDLSDFLFEEMTNNWVIAHTDKALLFRCNGIKIQTIFFKFFEKAEDIFDTFDFTVCMGAFDFDTERFILHKNFLKHNVSKIIKFNANTAYPIVAALRVAKYKDKGYSISKSEFLRIMLTILDCKINNYEELKSQIGGMYGENYDKLLEPKENEEFNIESIVEKMKYLNIDDHYFGMPKEKEIGDWDEFVCNLLGEKIKYFDYAGEHYRICKNNIEKIYGDDLSDKYELVNIDDVMKFPLIRYKYVKLNDDGSMCSFYDNNFKWVIGENSAKSSSCGLYAVKSSQLNICSYCNEADRVLLEVKVESIDDVNHIRNLLDDTCDYKRLIVTRVVPMSEAKDLNDRYNDIMFG